MNASGSSSSGSSTYSSFGYLEAGVDLPTWNLAPELGRVPSYQIELTGDQRDRVERLIQQELLISLHDHPVRFPADMAETPSYNRGGRQHTAFEGLANSKMTAIFDNMMDGTGCITATAPWKFDDIVIDLGMRQADIAHQDEVMVVRTLKDIALAKERSKVGLIFGLEAATPIENELDRLDILYGLGIRQIGIAYSDSNALGSGLGDRSDSGLTNFGHRAVRRMNQLGLAIDVSHSSDQTSLDVCRASEAPVLLTHGGARALWPTPRMKPDEVLVAIAESGGVIGISAAPHTTISKDHLEHSIESVMDHFSYIVDLVGIDHVGFGPDTLYGDHVAMHEVFRSMLGIGAISGGLSFPTVDYVDGLENPTENFVNICSWLVAHHYSDDEIAKVLGRNIWRALEHIWVS